MTVSQDIIVLGRITVLFKELLYQIIRMWLDHAFMTDDFFLEMTFPFPVKVSAKMLKYKQLKMIRQH